MSFALRASARSLGFLMGYKYHKVKCIYHFVFEHMEAPNYTRGNNNIG